MRRIVVLNSKGGCGKTTVATNLASRYARRGYETMLLDFDPQAAAAFWLKSRGDELPQVFGMAAAEDPSTAVARAWQMRIPPQIQCVVMDSPAGVRIPDMLPQLRQADAVVVPILPSPIDMHATAAFIQDLLLLGKLRSHGTRLGIVANRLRRNTLALGKLEKFLRRLDIPVIARLRDSQRYLQAVEGGYGVHEMPGAGAYGDRMVWDSVVDWLERQRHEELAHEFARRVRKPTWSAHE